MIIITLPKITVSRKNFSFYSHRGFGEKAYSHYQNTKKLQYVHNQLTGLELGIKNGADTLEIDICKTKDKKIVTSHGFPLSKQLQQTEQEYLREHPEALTIQELLDWIYHQDSNITLYLELKSPISLIEIVDEFKTYAIHKKRKNMNEILRKLYRQIMLYTQDMEMVKRLISEKKTIGLSTFEIRIIWLSLTLITTHVIDIISSIGSKDCRIYGIEQGMIPWGTKEFIFILQTPLGSFPPLLQIKKYFQNLSTIISYFQKNNLKFIIGTVDNLQWIHSLTKQGVNGIIPNNPNYFFKAGIVAKEKRHSQLFKKSGKYYIPPSMEKRLRK